MLRWPGLLLVLILALGGSAQPTSENIINGNLLFGNSISNVPVTSPFVLVLPNNSLAIWPRTPASDAVVNVVGLVRAVSVQYPALCALRYLDSTVVCTCFGPCPSEAAYLVTYAPALPMRQIAIRSFGVGVGLDINNRPFCWGSGTYGGYCQRVQQLVNTEFSFVRWSKYNLHLIRAGMHARPCRCTMC